MSTVQEVLCRSYSCRRKLIIEQKAHKNVHVNVNVKKKHSLLHHIIIVIVIVISVHLLSFLLQIQCLFYPIFRNDNNCYSVYDNKQHT